MAGYDAGGLIMTASTSDDILRLSGPDNGREMLGAMDAFDHDLNFEGDGLLCVSRPIAIVMPATVWTFGLMPGGRDPAASEPLSFVVA